jgi:hypothetical protein
MAQQVNTAMPYNISNAYCFRNFDFSKKYADEVWSETERSEFINWIAANPHAGDVVPGSSGCRKVRWTRQGMGKRGGTRVIYFNEVEGRIWLLIVYAKAKFDNLPAEFLAQLKREVENG